MSISTLHRLDAIIMPSSVQISVVKNARWSAGIQTFLEHPAGGIFPMFRANQHQKPQISFSTPQLDTLLAAVGPAGASVGQIDTYYKTASATGNVARATTSHQRVRISQSLVYWTQVRLTDKGMGEAQVMIQPVYDGVNDPFAYTGSVALASTLAAGNFFGAGPCKINGVSIPGIQEITIDSGIKVLTQGDSSEEFDTFAGIEEVNPSITIKTVETVNWSTILLRGTVLDGTNGVLCYGRKYSNYGSRVANGTAQHLAFTGLYGTAIPVETGGDGRSPLSDTIKIELVSTVAETSPLSVSTTSTIS